MKRLTVGGLLRMLESYREDWPDGFEDLEVYLGIVEEGELDSEAAQIEADPDAEIITSEAGSGAAYRVLLCYPGSTENTPYIMIEGENDGTPADGPLVEE